MLTSFTLENFKSFREPATLPLAPLTMLAGANASGKSNLVEALRLFSGLVEKDLIFFASEVALGGHKIIRGNFRNWAFQETGKITLSCNTNHQTWNRYSITLGLEDGWYVVLDERLTDTGKENSLFETVGREQFGSSEENHFNKLKRSDLDDSIHISVNRNSLALLTLQNIIQFDENQGSMRIEVLEVSAYYRDWISNISFVDPQPFGMRGYSSKSDMTLNETGSNLSGVLYYLSQDDETCQKLHEFVQSIPEQNISNIGFIETPRDEVMVKLIETFGGCESTFDASLLSDGTLRVLAIAAAVLSSKKGSVVVIEEIDNGIHPSRMGTLLQQLDDVARERNLRLLLTTHNPALLDALPQEAVPDVVFCFRHPETGASQLTRLSDLTDYSGLVARGGIGSLMTQGIVDRFVKNPRTPDEKRRQALAWLEEVRAETG